MKGKQKRWVCSWPFPFPSALPDTQALHASPRGKL